MAVTTVERVKALERFGYSEREAQFLELAALHSGYFVRRQFNTFIGHTRGGIAAAFIERLLDRRHATRELFIRQTHVYHLSAKPLYVALGQADNRHRRSRSPYGIKAKLMALEFVLEHRSQRFLATEQEHVEYFLNHGVQRERLPHLTYGSARSGPPTDRYFVEKFPVSVPLSDSAESVTVTYIDPGEYDVDGFDTFLGRYGALICALTRVRLVYVADTTRNFGAAQARFEKWRRIVCVAGGVSPGAISVATMVRHFGIRQLAEANELATVSVAELRQFRETRTRFAPAEGERLYGIWKHGGEPALRAAIVGIAMPAPMPIVDFATFRLTHDYSFLGAPVYA